MALSSYIRGQISMLDSLQTITTKKMTTVMRINTVQKKVVLGSKDCQVAAYFHLRKSKRFCIIWQCQHATTANFLKCSIFFKMTQN